MQPGFAAIANYGTLGATVWSGSKIIGESSPTNLNRLVPYNTVQEQSVAWGAGGSFSFFDTATGSGPPPEIRLRFTDLAQLANVTSGWTILTSEGYATNTLALTDCQLRGGYLSMYSASSNAFPYVAFTNNLALRTDLHFTQGYQTTPYPASLYLRNNLFWGGSLSIVALSANNTWEAKDNLFDTVSLSTTNSATFANSNNGYYQTTPLPGGSNNKTLTAVDYQAGPLGNFYYPTNGTNLNSLRDAGSVTNAGLVGLYHYTTTTNQVREGGTPVDIGAHFVALNAAGNPIDSDNDGLPDYFENTSGSGVVGAGETDYLNPDTDYDGRNDYQEFLEGTNPLDANSFTPVRLGYWRFNTADWKGQQGQLPLQYTNVQNVISTNLDGNALQVTGPNPALLKYRDVETNALANINCRNGSIILWYKPFWFSDTNAGGFGPGHWVRLLEMGNFALSIDPTGTQLVFQSPDSNGQVVTNAIYSLPDSGFLIDSSKAWIHLGAVFSSSQASFFVNNRLGGPPVYPPDGFGISNVPPTSVRALGFSVGSSSNGLYQAEGLIDELETYNYPIGRFEVSFFQTALSASNSTSPTKVTVSEKLSFGTVQRKRPTDTNWTTVATAVNAFTYTDSDTNLLIGQRYEYLVGGQYGGYLLTGVNATPIDYRGKVILLVDQTLTNALATNLALLKQDLVGDGWKVIRHDAPRHDDTTWSNNPPNIALIKSWITNDYNADPTNTKAIYIVGHVSIPFSGWLSPDGHPARPFPADAYYGSIGETNWTDYSVNQQTNGVSNVPGDGIFDQNSLPANQCLGVGRVDFANMPAFNTTNIPGVLPKSETDLIKQYLNKNHGFRNKTFQFADRSIFSSDYYPDPIFDSDSRTTSRLYGFDPPPVDAGDPLVVTKNSHLFGFAAGYGGPDAMNVIGNDHHSVDLADPSKEPMVGFYVLSASYFGAWHLTDDFLRATIATPTYGLEALYGRNTSLYLEPLALGEPASSGVARTITNQTTDVEITLLGDPTLRFQITAPPANLVATTNQSSVNLTWAPSTESGAQYFVYRSTNGLDGDFLKVSHAISTSSFTDTSPPAGPKMYAVRTAKLVTTASGSFTNLSQSISSTVNQ